MAPRKPNQKVVAAKERKAAHLSEQNAKAAREREKVEAAEWSKGSDIRGATRAESAALKADEAARKRREKAELLAEEEVQLGGGGGKPKKAPGAGTSAKRGKGKKKDGLGLLEEALVGDADKKAKAAKKKERERKEREERLRAERERREREEAANMDPLLANTDAMIGAASPPDTDGRDAMPVGRAANVADAGAAVGSGIDQALGALAVGPGGEDRHPEKRVKALHKAFEERMMPEMREQYPGLKQSQYKDKIFQLWKKSPENPMNQKKG